jgi:hypothetical protein
MTNGKNEIARWIDGLSDPDLEARHAFALRLHLAGTHLCTSASSAWMEDPGFAELLPPNSPGAPSQPHSDRLAYVVGVAVRPETFDRIRHANGSPPLADVPPDQDAREFELGFGDHVDFDILTTRDLKGTGAIARYLQKFGEGIQQIEINVTNVGEATNILRDRFGLAPVYPATRPGADGTRVNFFLVPIPGGEKVLIELVEPSAKS